jgi:superfamily II DNA helicase RecQ
MDVHKALKRFFGYAAFASIMVNRYRRGCERRPRKSLLAVFPTGGGKSIISASGPDRRGGVHGLTVVISPFIPYKDQSTIWKHKALWPL